MRILICLLIVCFRFILPSAQSSLKYQTPPAEIVALIDGPKNPSVMISPDKKRMLLIEQSDFPSIEELAEEELRLAGIRINPRNFGPSRANYSTGISYMNLSDLKEVKINGLPSVLRMSSMSFNNSGSMLAFLQAEETEVQLWVIDFSTNQARKIGSNLNQAMGKSFTWLDDITIIGKEVNVERSNVPSSKEIPDGPVIQESSGKAAPARTFQDLLKNPADEAMFTYYTSSRLVKWKVLSAEKISMNVEGAISNFQPSPDGNFILVTNINKPFSYLVPYSLFPSTTKVYDKNGLLVQKIHDSPLAENIPKGFNATVTGKRSIYWRADKPSMLYWVEAQDGGDPNKEAAIRDKVFMQNIPNGAVLEGPVTTLRYGGVTWGNDNMALLTESWWATRKTKTTMWNPSLPAQSGKVIFDRSYEDRYSDPGSFLTEPNQYGWNVLAMSANKKSLYLSGMGASPEGNQPFIDQYEISNAKTKRLWQSQAPYYEMPVTPIDLVSQTWIIRRESKTMPPNYLSINLKDKKTKTLTEFPNPYVGLDGVTSEIISYERADGLKLTGKLYLPAGYNKEKDGPLPVFMWAYPREFKSAEAASQMSTSPYEFTRLNWGSPIYWVTQGYAIFDDFSMPIVGEGDAEPNETFVEQLRTSAEAAINTLVNMGVADRNKIGVGGHSYGAFMTANLLAHTNLFAGGIARSGAYNRTLTPFGFQSEQRSYWEAPEVYTQMSPFSFADKIKTPILLIHGEADNNSGTFPMQSERFFSALKGHGATTRLVMLPHESHGYRARQSIMHTLWEMNQWLDTHVKNSKKSTQP